MRKGDPRIQAEQYAKELMDDYSIHGTDCLGSAECGKADSILDDIAERFLSFLGYFREDE